MVKNETIVELGWGKVAVIPVEQNGVVNKVSFIPYSDFMIAGGLRNASLKDILERGSVSIEFASLKGINDFLDLVTKMRDDMEKNAEKMKDFKFNQLLEEGEPDRKRRREWELELELDKGGV